MKILINGVYATGKTEFGNWLQQTRGFAHYDLEAIAREQWDPFPGNLTFTDKSGIAVKLGRCSASLWSIDFDNDEILADFQRLNPWSAKALTTKAARGANQRVAQELLGHSDPTITAKVYTDVPAMGLHVEIARFPWIQHGEAVAHCGAQKSGIRSPSMSLDGVMAMFIDAMKVHDVQKVSHALASAVASCREDRMAAQGGIRDKILRVSMSFETGKNSTRKANKEIPQKRRFTGTASYPWSAILKVHSWTAHLREGRVRSCAEIARREGITRARVSQLWPLGKITREQFDDALTASKGGEVSLRGLIRIARSPDMKTEGPEPENMASG